MQRSGAKGITAFVEQTARSRNIFCHAALKSKVLIHMLIYKSEGLGLLHISENIFSLSLLHGDFL